MQGRPISRRRRRWNLVLVIALVAALTVAVFAVKQPWVGRGEVRAPVVDAKRLEAHAAVLSDPYCDAVSCLTTEPALAINWGITPEGAHP